MGYYDYLKELLAPTGLYRLDGGAGAAELEVIGNELDAIFAELEEISGECLPCTAENYGLTLYERLMPYRPAYLTISDERKALLALLRIRGGCFTPTLLQETVAGCGLTALVSEGEDAQTVEVSFPRNRGVPENIDKLKSRVEEILPCHLAVEYVYIYTTWQELMTAFGSWGGIESLELSWEDMATFLPEE